VLWTGGTKAFGDEGFLVRGGAEPFDVVDYPGPSPRGIWGSDESDVWIAPHDGDMHHFDGTRWEAIAGRLDQPLTAIHGTRPDDIWAVGLAGTILHWDGSRWTSVPSDTTAHLFGVWSIATDDVWVVGAAGTILHWNGMLWES
jgi:hypothetical protein